MEGASPWRNGYLPGGGSYRLNLPANIPAANFWSVTLYEAENASGLANGQPFPSLGLRDKPVQNTDGSTDPERFVVDRSVLASWSTKQAAGSSRSSVNERWVFATRPGGTQVIYPAYRTGN